MLAKFPVSPSPSYGRLSLGSLRTLSGSLPMAQERPRLRIIVFGFLSERSVRDSVRSLLRVLSTAKSVESERLNNQPPKRRTTAVSLCVVHERGIISTPFHFPLASFLRCPDCTSQPWGYFSPVVPLMFNFIYVRIPLITHIVIAHPERSGLRSLCLQGEVHSP